VRVAKPPAGTTDRTSVEGTVREGPLETGTPVNGTAAPAKRLAC
jgi:hypothetical protein